MDQSRSMLEAYKAQLLQVR